MAAPPLLLLASMSPRRSALLTQIGVPHRIAAPHLDERVLPGESAADYVLRMARGKARALARAPGALPVLAADTSVVLDEAILGKPADAAAGAAMLLALAGRTHEVLTAVALASDAGLSVRLSASRVRFRAIAPAEAGRYWASGEPRDKAGGYAVQGLGAVFIEHLEGSYSGVMGLPLFETAALLAAAGVPLWPAPGAA